MAIPQGMTRKQWGEFVVRGRALSGQFSHNAWAFGDLLAEMIPPRPKYGRKRKEYPETVEQIIISFMQETACPYSLDAMINFRTCSIAWPEEERVVTCSWASHKELMGNRHLLKPGMTAEAAREARKNKNSPATPTIADIIINPAEEEESAAEIAEIKPIGVTANECLRAAVDWTRAATKRARDGQRIRPDLLMKLNQEARVLDEASYKEYEQAV